MNKKNTSEGLRGLNYGDYEGGLFRFSTDKTGNICERCSKVLAGKLGCLVTCGTLDKESGEPAYELFCVPCFAEKAEATA